MRESDIRAAAGLPGFHLSGDMVTLDGDSRLPDPQAPVNVGPLIALLGDAFCEVVALQGGEYDVLCRDMRGEPTIKGRGSSIGEACMAAALKLRRWPGGVVAAARETPPGWTWVGEQLIREESIQAISGPRLEGGIWKAYVLGGVGAGYWESYCHESCEFLQAWCAETAARIGGFKQGGHCWISLTSVTQLKVNEFNVMQVSVGSTAISIKCANRSDAEAKMMEWAQAISACQPEEKT